MTNDNYQPKTLGNTIEGWADWVLAAGHDIQELAHELRSPEVAVDPTVHETANTELETIANKLDRAARALRALQQHTLNPPEALNIDGYDWAVSVTNGRSLRVVEGEFTARRFARMTPAARYYRRERTASGRTYPVGTELLYGDASASTGGWEEVTHNG